MFTFNGHTLLKMGAETADDLSYLREAEVEELVGSLGLPILKQRKLADKLLQKQASFTETLYRALVGFGRKAEL